MLPWPLNSVVVSGYDRPFVAIELLPGATARQRRMREKWMSAEP